MSCLFPTFYLEDTESHKYYEFLLVDRFYNVVYKYAINFISNTIKPRNVGITLDHLRCKSPFC